MDTPRPTFAVRSGHSPRDTERMLWADAIIDALPALPRVMAAAVLVETASYTLDDILIGIRSVAQATGLTCNSPFVGVMRLTEEVAPEAEEERE